MTYSTIAIIYNPNSTGSSKDLADDFKTAIKKRLPKQKIELIATEYAGHAEELAYEISKKSKQNAKKYKVKRSFKTLIIIMIKKCT